MAKYTLFTMVGNNLVYRNTGRIYQKGYTVKGSTVYSKETGRKIGTVSQKLTKKQKTVVERAKSNRAKKIQKVLKRYGAKTDGLSYQSLALTGELRGMYPDIPLSRYESSLQNFAIVLSKAVDDGILDKETAQAMLNKYVGASNDSERSKIWLEFEEYAKDEDWKYLPY